ncbi:MAG TPA: FAD-binding protein, partial [Solirubrobacteraceae bacterium]|nr:FAD-binding protein [Solirubrobacteraceae bacterium]
DGRSVPARAVVICAGGAAAMWARTTNPPGSLGTGMLLAHAAGARLADLEFMQFHPTAVTGVPGREGFLMTEAIRGEGGVLVDGDGERFVDELAPRDAVSRAIDERLRASGEAQVWLDMRSVDPALFPNIAEALAERGVDVTRELVPVAPAAHYMVGGIVTDLDGRSSVAGLYAVGESACTGLHGANRLASNSLSECFVFGARAAQRAVAEPPLGPRSRARACPPPTLAVTGATKAALWERAGLLRTRAGLEPLLDDPSPLARMIAACALAREETRGVHARADFPALDPGLDGRHSIVAADGSVGREAWA